MSKEQSKTKYDERHGGPFARGKADFWYGRGRQPHYFKGASYDSEKVEEKDLTKEELEAYNAGYDEMQKQGITKQTAYQ
jgi:hypothetical protein